MAGSSNGSEPNKTTERIATELRGRLEQRLGQERTEAIWRDPTNVEEVVENEEEAASVAGILLEAWKDLPAGEEEEEEAAQPKRRSRFRRGLRLAIIAAVAVWAVSIISKARRGDEDSEPF